MPAGYYDLVMDQGEDYVLHLQYLDSENSATGSNAINVAGYTLSRFQIRRSDTTPYILLDVGISGATSGGSTGEFLSGGGVGGSGYFLLNKDEEGTASLTGGIYIRVPASTTRYVPGGRHFYEFELKDTNTTSKLVRGRMDVNPGVIR